MASLIRDVMHSVACVDHVLAKSLQSSPDPDAQTAGHALSEGVIDRDALHVLADRMMARGVEQGEWLASWLTAYGGPGDASKHLTWVDKAARSVDAWQTCDRVAVYNDKTYSNPLERRQALTVSIAATDSGFRKYLRRQAFWVLSGEPGGVWVFESFQLDLQNPIDWTVPYGIGVSLTLVKVHARRPTLPVSDEK